MNSTRRNFFSGLLVILLTGLLGSYIKIIKRLNGAKSNGRLDKIEQHIRDFQGREIKADELSMRNIREDYLSGQVYHQSGWSFSQTEIKMLSFNRR